MLQRKDLAEFGKDFRAEKRPLALRKAIHSYLHGQERWQGMAYSLGCAAEGMMHGSHGPTHSGSTHGRHLQHATRRADED